MTEAAIEAYREMVARQPDSLVGHIYLAASFGELNREEEAGASAQEVLRIDPNFSIKKYVDTLSYSDPEQAVRFEEGLRKAGLPE